MFFFSLPRRLHDPPTPQKKDGNFLNFLGGGGVGKPKTTIPTRPSSIPPPPLLFRVRTKFLMMMMHAVHANRTVDALPPGSSE